MLSFSSMLLAMGCDVLAVPPLLGPLDADAVPWRDCRPSGPVSTQQALQDDAHASAQGGPTCKLL